MQRAGCRLLSTITTSNEQHSIVIILNRCLESSNLLYGRAIHANLIKTFVPSLYLHNLVLNFYLKSGHLSCGIKLFDKMPERNVVSWSSIIAGFVHHGHFDEALHFFSHMHFDSMVYPNEFTLVSTLNACSFCESRLYLYQIYAYILKLGFVSNVFVVNALLTALIRHGMFLEAKGVFDECLNKDIVSWNSMMSGFLQHSCIQLPKFCYQMICENLKPDHFTYATVLTGLTTLCDLNMGLQVHAHLIKSGHGADICVGNSLCDMYMKNWRLADGFNIFYGMDCRDVRSWTQLASGFLQSGEPSKALDLISEMRKIGVKPNKFTLATALNASAHLASLDDGKKFHAFRIKLGSQADVCVDNALLDMYAKSGCMDEARVVFRSMPYRNVVSWTTAIMGCAQNGHAREALDIFYEMRIKAIEPNYITFICVLYACSQGGFIDEGWKYFFAMSNDHGISPGEDHYACMVNLLGRAGHIKEAKELISRMPFKPGVLVWQTLLAACQLHGDMETGKQAAEHAMNWDGIDPSTYVLLSNTFAGLKNWRRVGMLRKLMGNRDVKKVPGLSWIGTEIVC